MSSVLIPPRRHEPAEALFCSEPDLGASTLNPGQAPVGLQDPGPGRPRNLAVVVIRH